MKILGLHFGHDAAATVIEDGKVIAYVMRERISQIKHALGLDKLTINTVLQRANLTLQDIDYVSITSTQRKELVFTEWQEFKVIFDQTPTADIPLTLNNDLKLAFNRSHEQSQLPYQIYSAFYPEQIQAPEAVNQACGWLDDYINFPQWNQKRGLKAIADTGFSDFIGNDDSRLGFHYPVTVELEGYRLPGYFIHHHLCHAAMSFYTSPFEQAAILTHDGHSHADTYNTGMFYYGNGHKIYPLAPHHLCLGNIYDAMGIRLNLGVIGPAGKLMGLSSWGEARFDPTLFVGNWFDLQNRLGKGTDVKTAWYEYCLQQAQQLAYDLAPLAVPSAMTAAINADLAASTQLLFNQTMLQATSSLHQGLVNSGINTTQLCLSGGTALNCPTNSQLWQHSAFNEIYIEPCCDDSGIAIGAALALYHNIFDHPRRLENNSPFVPYQGGTYSVEHEMITQFIEEYPHLEFSYLKQPEQHAAKALHQDQVVAWFSGASEIGPRALGHRSILANPSYAENWLRVNQIKQRESWRPFAPIVLVDHATSWFQDCPNPSPYMLFNAKVIQNNIPAVTHVDQSARIQTIDASNGRIYDILQQFFLLSDIPVLMNTSFNGPKQPIIETPKQAVAFFAQSALNALYLDHWLITIKE